MNGTFRFLKSCLDIFGNVGNSDGNTVSVGFVGAKVRQWKRKLAREKSMSFMMLRYICVRNFGAIERPRSRLGGRAVWQRLACLSSSGSITAEISVRTPRKLYVLIDKKIYF